MSFKPSGSPYQLKSARIRAFAGIGGPRYQLIRRFTREGWDVSNSMCNDISDLNCGEMGSMGLRDGCRKISHTGKTSTCHTIIFMTLGGKKRYGIQTGQTLDVIDIPEWYNLPQASFVLDPTEAIGAVSTQYTAADICSPL